MRPLRFARLWAAVGWLGVAAGLVLSLWPHGAPLPFHVWDKVEHATGYFLLTTWFTGIYRRERYPAIAVGCFLLGVSIELLQALTPTRTAEVADALANGVGIGLALGAARLGLAGWAVAVERRLGLAAA